MNINNIVLPKKKKPRCPVCLNVIVSFKKR